MSIFGDKKKEPETVNLTPEQIVNAFGNIQTQIAAQADNTKSMLEGMANLTTTVTNMTNASAVPAADKQTPAEPEPTASEEDLEAMTNGQLFAHMIGGVEKLLDANSAKQQESVNAVAATQRATAVSQQMKELANAEGTKDFYKWTEQIKELHAKGVSTDPETLYHEARRRNPEQALAFDKELEQNGQTKDDETDNTDQNNIKSLFGGMAPSSTGGDAESKEDFETAIEAGNAAFEEAFEGVPETIWRG